MVPASFLKSGENKEHQLEKQDDCIWSVSRQDKPVPCLAVSSKYISSARSLAISHTWIEIHSQQYWFKANLYRNLWLVTFPNIRLSENEKWVQKCIRHNVPNISLYNEKYRWDLKARNCVDIRKTGNQLTKMYGLRAIKRHSLRKVLTINAQVFNHTDFRPHCEGDLFETSDILQ